MLISILFGSLGQLLLKLGAKKLGNLNLTGHTLLKEILQTITTPEIFSGLAFFSISCLLWIKVLTKFELSYAYPMVSLGYVGVAVLSYIFLNESISLNKILGIGIIITGVVVINS